MTYSTLFIITVLVTFGSNAKYFWGFFLYILSMGKFPLIGVINFISCDIEYIQVKSLSVKDESMSGCGHGAAWKLSPALCFHW